MFDKLAAKIFGYLFRKSSPMPFKQLVSFDSTGKMTFSEEIATDTLIEIVSALLGKSSLTLAQRNKLETEILDTLEALPLKEVFSITENGEMTVRGKVIEYDKAIRLREYANSALDNQLLNLIREQVAYEAIAGGIHKCITPEDLYFYRAALWWGQRELAHLKSIAVRE